MVKKLVYICGVMILTTLLSACGGNREINEHNKENDFVIVDSDSENKGTDVKTSSINKENDIILDGRYAVPNSDVMFAFSKDGKAAQSGNIHVNIGTYKTTEKNIIEVHYITQKYWNDANGNVEINDIDLYEYITVDDNNNVYLMDIDGRQNKLERYGDVTKEDFEIVDNNSQNKKDNINVRKSIQSYLNLVGSEDASPSSMIRTLGFDLINDYNNHDVQFFIKTNIKYDAFKQEMLKYVSESWFENRFGEAREPNITNYNLGSFYKNVNGILYIADVGASGEGYKVKNITHLERDAYIVEYDVIFEEMILSTNTAKFNIDLQTYLITYCEL